MLWLWVRKRKEKAVYQRLNKTSTVSDVKKKKKIANWAGYTIPRPRTFCHFLILLSHLIFASHNSYNSTLLQRILLIHGNRYATIRPQWIFSPWTALCEWNTDCRSPIKHRKAADAKPLLFPTFFDWTKSCYLFLFNGWIISREVRVPDLVGNTSGWGGMGEGS